MIGTEPLLCVQGATKHFPVARPNPFHRPEVVHALDDVTFNIYRGEAFGVVGESGCGKSTLAACIVGLHKLTAGSIQFEGVVLGKASSRTLRSIRRNVQMVFQDSYGSLNPAKRVGRIIGDPIRIHRVAPPQQINDRVTNLMKRVGLGADLAERYPFQFSGGQRQRIGVARALALQPKLVIADEPVSALDVSIQAQVVNLLVDLKREFHLTLMFVAHNLAVVRHVCDRVAVMYLGKIVEISPADALYAQPIHPYTEALLAAVPIPEADRTRTSARLVVEGDVPSSIRPPSGCRFHPRCRYATEICRAREPEMRNFGAGHLAACHHPLERDQTP